MKRLLTALARALGILCCSIAPASGEGLKSDFDGNGIVDLGDFFLFAEHFGTTAGQAAFETTYDIIGDGRIDQTDFFVFAQNFGVRPNDPPPVGPVRTYLYVADTPGNGVSVIDAATNLVLTYIPFRGPSGIAVSPDQRTTYFVDLYSFLVLREDFNVDYTLPLSIGAKVALSPDGRRAFITEGPAGDVLFVDLDRRAVTDTVHVGRAPLGISSTPDGRTVVVVNTGSRGGGLSFIDVQTRSVKDTLMTTTNPGHVAISPDGRRAFLNSATGGTITVVDPVSRKALGGIQTGGTSVYGMGFSPDGKKLYATSGGRIVVVDVDRNLIADRISLADDAGPLAVSPDGKRLYVSGFSQSGGGAAVYIVDLEARQALGKIRGFAFPSDLAFRSSSVDIPPARRNKPGSPPVGSAWRTDVPLSSP